MQSETHFDRGNHRICGIFSLWDSDDAHVLFYSNFKDCWKKRFLCSSAKLGAETSTSARELLELSFETYRSHNFSLSRSFCSTQGALRRAHTSALEIASTVCCVKFLCMKLHLCLIWDLLARIENFSKSIKFNRKWCFVENILPISVFRTILNRSHWRSSIVLSSTMFSTVRLNWIIFDIPFQACRVTKTNKFVSHSADFFIFIKVLQWHLIHAFECVQKNS